MKGTYGRGQAAVLREAVHKRLLAHQAAGDLPTSNRFILYELRQHQPAALFGHKSRGQGRSEDQNLSDASKWLRDRGLVPWLGIVDATRTLTEYLYADTVADYTAQAVDRAPSICWLGSRHRCSSASRAPLAASSLARWPPSSCAR